MAANREATLAKWGVFVEAMINTGQPSKAAKLAGYKGTPKVLAANASRLLASPEIKKMLAKRRAALKKEGALAVNDPEMVRERLAISTQDKREFLWALAHECARVTTKEEICEHVDEEGTLIRTVTVTERVFMPMPAIEAIAQLNEMDGDIQPPKAPVQNGAFSIEQLLLSITQNNH